MPQRNDDLVLELDTIRLVIAPSVGASIAALQFRHPDGDWANILRQMPDDSTDSADAGSFLMLPWTNRVKDAKFTFQGSGHTLIQNLDDGTAIHGVARDHAWNIVDRSPITARLTYRHKPDPSCPFAFGGVVRYEIAPRRVEMDLSVTNLGDSRMPAGCGHHPYFHRHLHDANKELRIKMGVTGRYTCDNCIPSGPTEDDDACALLRSGDPIGNPGLDDVFAGFDGNATLEWPGSNVRLKIECDDSQGHVVVYTPRNENGSPDEFVCVEPVTMVNDGFNLFEKGHEGTGVRVLAPGETLSTKTVFSIGSID